MVKCFLIGTYFALCTPQPVDEECVRLKLTPHIHSLALMPNTVESVIEVCSVRFNGCCAWHQGVKGCLEDGRLMCKDGTASESCDCKTEGDTP